MIGELCLAVVIVFLALIGALVYLRMLYKAGQR